MYTLDRKKLSNYGFTACGYITNKLDANVANYDSDQNNEYCMKNGMAFLELHINSDGNFMHLAGTDSYIKIESEEDLRELTDLFKNGKWLKFLQSKMENTDGTYSKIRTDYYKIKNKHFNVSFFSKSFGSKTNESNIPYKAHTKDLDNF